MLSVLLLSCVIAFAARRSTSQGKIQENQESSDELLLGQVFDTFANNGVDVRQNLRSLIPNLGEAIPENVKESSLAEYLRYSAEFCLARSCQCDDISNWLHSGSTEDRDVAEQQAYSLIYILIHRKFLKLLEAGAPAICQLYPVDVLDSIENCKALVEPRKREIDALIESQAEELLKRAREYVGNIEESASRCPGPDVGNRKQDRRLYLSNPSKDIHTLLGCPRESLEALRKFVSGELRDKRKFLSSFKRLTNPREDFWTGFWTHFGQEFLASRILEKALDQALPGWDHL